jgi:hypothetical protein
MACSAGSRFEYTATRRRSHDIHGPAVDIMPAANDFHGRWVEINHRASDLHGRSVEMRIGANDVHVPPVEIMRCANDAYAATVENSFPEKDSRKPAQGRREKGIGRLQPGNETPTAGMKTARQRWDYHGKSSATEARRHREVDFPKNGGRGERLIEGSLERFGALVA